MIILKFLRTDDGARSVLIKLVHKCAARIRRHGYWARRMEVYISYTYREEGWRADLNLGVCQDTPTMVKSFGDLWPHRPAPAVAGVRPTQVAITLHDLVKDQSATLPLFPEEQGRLRLCRAIDAVNARFGPDKIFLSSMYEVLDSAPTRIAFTQIPEWADADTTTFVGAPR